MSKNQFANADRVEINEEIDYTATCEVPAWDERYIILPGVYKAVFRQYFQGHGFTNVVVKARVVSAKKSALWGGVAVTEGRGPDAGTVHFAQQPEREIPVTAIQLCKAISKLVQTLPGEATSHTLIVYAKTYSIVTLYNDGLIRPYPAAEGRLTDLYNVLDNIRQDRVTFGTRAATFNGAPACSRCIGRP